MARNTYLAILAMDERTIVQRKMAIAMYGYSWLKPAGCAKTMLGRREEELEREEVEKQLREVELQERLALEAEEQERLAARDALGETQDDRDLDGDIPDAEEDDDDDEEEDEDGEDGWVEDEDSEAMMHTGFDMEGDLDDDVPEADDGDDDAENENDEDGDEAQDQSEAWVYDTRREPDSDEDGGQLLRARNARHAHIAGVRVPVPGSEYEYDEQEAEDLANAMLDEDEIFEDEQNMGMEGERDLDDDVPDADEGQWEHTDTEAEESEMDISILPAGQEQPAERMTLGGMGQQQPAHPHRVVGGRTTRASASRDSGSWIASPHTRLGTTDAHRSTPDVSVAGGAYPRESAGLLLSGNRHGVPQARPPHPHYMRTPAMLDTPLDRGEDAREEGDEPFASSTGPFRTHARPAVRGGVGATTVMESEPGSGPERGGSRRIAAAGESPSRATAARAWLDGAAAAVGGSARRTLFGRAARRGPAATTATTTTTAGASAAINLSGRGGLFTPSPGMPGPGHGHVGAESSTSTPVDQNGGQDQAQGQRRSGRFLNSRRRAAQ